MTLKKMLSSLFLVVGFLLASGCLALYAQNAVSSKQVLTNLEKDEAIVSSQSFRYAGDDGAEKFCLKICNSVTGQYFLFINSRKTGPYDEIARLHTGLFPYSPNDDGSKICISAVKNDKQFLVTADGRVSGPFPKDLVVEEAPAGIDIRKGWIFSAHKNDAEHYVITSKGETYGPFEKNCIICTNDDASRWSFLAVLKKKTYVVFSDGTRLGPYDDWSGQKKIYSRKDDSHGAYMLRKNGRWYAVLTDKKTIGPLDSLDSYQGEREKSGGPLCPSARGNGSYSSSTMKSSAHMTGFS